jgi:hypothetical protein
MGLGLNWNSLSQERLPFKGIHFLYASHGESTLQIGGCIGANSPPVIKVLMNLDNVPRL